MIAHEPRTLGYYAASHWLQGAVYFVVIGALAIGLLSALVEMNERAEKQSVELTIRNMRTGMRLAIGEALMHQREAEIATWAGSNPVRWLDSPPAGYRGECSGEEKQGLTERTWCFDRSRGELLYRPHRADHLQALPDGGSRGCRTLSWRVASTPESKASGGFVGLRLEAASPCQWLIEG